MPLAKHTYHTAAPIPPHISRSEVLVALHDHNTCLSLQALTAGHELLPSTDPTTLKDPFWYPTDTYPPSTYRVTEIIKYLPWFSWAKYSLVFPSVFQSTPQGLKTRADTSGVVLRAEYRVLEEGVEREGEGLEDGGWVLVEDVEVVCVWWMMPLVRGKMEEAHRDICQKVVETVVREKEEKEREAASREAGKGKQREAPLDGSYVHVGGDVGPPLQRQEMEKITYG
ncbi:uncharacterized protein N0V89_008967 [Didymosphaeria variabile]|uniref:DUF7053 domain-containing protein n=1 Tax=Didymosphaeria variabile TaxID=1932322 RepID=A0A9W9C923_9PLEO|nr:uncharacterized protein N0V89_008967 [Didymosphaeria variabile]KAJ4350346.1 hypothetical protein N0V89_008967 [Didymosphaeria variabile]